jgi:hypothetical protein
MKGFFLSIVLFFSFIVCGQELPPFIQNAVEELAEGEADLQLDDLLLNYIVCGAFLKKP